MMADNRSVDGVGVLTLTTQLAARLAITIIKWKSSPHLSLFLQHFCHLDTFFLPSLSSISLPAPIISCFFAEIQGNNICK